MHGWVLEKETQRWSPLAGLSSNVYAQSPELGLQLSRENKALHEDNQNLRLQHDHISQGGAGLPASPGLCPRAHCLSVVAVTPPWSLSPELTRVQEALVAACSRAREAEVELEQRRGKQRRLAEELAEQQENVRQLRDERLSLQEDNNR